MLIETFFLCSVLTVLCIMRSISTASENEKRENKTTKVLTLKVMFFPPKLTTARHTSCLTCNNLESTSITCGIHRSRETPLDLRLLKIWARLYRKLAVAYATDLLFLRCQCYPWKGQGDARTKLNTISKCFMSSSAQFYYSTKESYLVTIVRGLTSESLLLLHRLFLLRLEKRLTHTFPTGINM